jgi:arylsulfatase A-like enzyme
VSKRTLCTLDILPTLAKLAGAELPKNPIDGKDVWDIVTGKEGANNPHEYYPFSTGRTFEGVISGDGKWKLHLPHKYRTLVKPGNDGRPGKYAQKKIELSLFDMENDPCEKVNVIDRHPEVAAKMKKMAENHRRKFYGK